MKATNDPHNGVPENGTLDADPFDIVTGIYFRRYPDLYVEDSIPLIFGRTQRNMDPRSRSFGIGGATSYDMFIIGDTKKFSWVALVTPDGSQIRYSRISPGTGYADGVFEDTTSPTEFLGSRISWNHASWKVTLRNGTEYEVQGCSASSKPGQCGVAQISNAKGDRVMILRDRDGNIVKIISPHQHFISVQSDAAGRITRAQDDQGHWVTYEYAPAGWLKKAQTWRGETDEFKYDARFNMIWAGEKDRNTPPGKYKFTVTNRYDSKDRFQWQKVDFGKAVEVYSAKYHETPNGRIRQTDVWAPEGLSHYHFNNDRYETREEFVPRHGTGWTLNLARDPKTNATTGAWLTCPEGRFEVSGEASHELEELGDDHKDVTSGFCSLMARRRHARAQRRSTQDKI